MKAYAEAYLDDVVENQGKLFDFVAQSFPDKPPHKLSFSNSPLYE